MNENIAMPSTAQLVQTIVVRPSTHFDTITAVAFASGLALARADLRADPWQSWLAGSFTKSVRRVKRAVDYERITLLELPSTEIAIGDAVALSFEPWEHDSSPREISRLQVSGLDLIRETSSGSQYSRPGATRALTPRVEVNADVTMSTGKTAAQVAHAPRVGS